MVSIVDRVRPGGARLFHAAVLAGALALFLGALLTDYAYWTTYLIQWSNFASWLLVGAMVLTSVAVICEILALVRGGRSIVHIVVLVATPVWGDGSAIRKQTLDFAATFANEVYRVCPWAAPQGE